MSGNTCENTLFLVVEFYEIKKKAYFWEMNIYLGGMEEFTFRKMDDILENYKCLWKHLFTD